MTTEDPRSGDTGGEGEVDELLLPPQLSSDAVRPLVGGRTVEMGGDTMGTGWSLTAVVPPDLADDVISRAIERSFALVIGQMSQWEPSSDISCFNRSEAGTRFCISPQFAHVLDCALKIAEASEGAFDPTLGEAAELWGFGAGVAPLQVPDAEQTEATRRFSWHDVLLEDGGASLLQPGGLTLDFSGIAKGFAVDLAIHMLEQLGVRHALMEIGGELRGVGVRADGMPWWVDLDVPPGSDAPLARIGLTGWAIATSGNYRRRREAQGASWSHTLDPLTGMPVDDDVLAVSVLHKGCMQADALASAIMVLGIDAGLNFANRFAIPARIITREAMRVSDAWQVWREQ